MVQIEIEFRRLYRQALRLALDEPEPGAPGSKAWSRRMAYWIVHAMHWKAHAAILRSKEVSLGGELALLAAIRIRNSEPAEIAVLVRDVLRYAPGTCYAEAAHRILAMAVNRRQRERGSR
jgi:hypothetical protein